LWRRAFHQARKFTGNISVTFSDESIHVETSDAVSELKWSIYSGYLDTPESEAAAVQIPARPRQYGNPVDHGKDREARTCLVSPLWSAVAHLDCLFKTNNDQQGQPGDPRQRTADTSKDRLTFGHTGFLRFDSVYALKGSP
jgi:hypothetical protein